MKHLIPALFFVLLIGLAAFADAEDRAPLLPSDELLKLLKDRAEPFDNVKIDFTQSGRDVHPPILYPRTRMGHTIEPRPEMVSTYEASETLMFRGKQVTFERERTQQVPSEDGTFFFHKTKRKWSNVAGHIRESDTPDGENGKVYMTLRPLPEDSVGDSAHVGNLLLALGAGIGRIMESIESIQHEPNGNVTVRGTVLLRGGKGDCTMRLNEDYFPLQISILMRFGESRQEIYEVHVDEIAKVAEHRYGKSGKFVYKELTIQPDYSFRFKFFDDYAYEVSEIRLGISDEEFESFSSMPVTLDMHVRNYLPEPDKQTPLPNLPLVGL